MLATLKEDVENTLRRDPAMKSTADVLLHHTGMRAVWSYRRAHWLWERGAHGLASRVAKRARKRYGVEIHPAATIGRRFMIDHGMGVVIGATAIIGDDCLIYQGVTLGMTGKHGGKRHPTLGDNVMVGAGAIVLGNITVGDSAKIAAGAVVVHDVPAHVTVAGNPAHVVREHACPVLRFAELVVKPADVDENIRWSCGL